MVAARRAKRVPWDEALAYYLAEGPQRSYRKVAAKFAVSDSAVRKHAKQHDWEERVASFDDAAAREAEHRGVRLRADRIAETIEIVNQARLRFSAQLQDPEFQLRGSDLAALLRIEALLEGEATERIDRSELDSELRRWLRVIREFVPEERWEEFLQELETTT